MKTRRLVVLRHNASQAWKRVEVEMPFDNRQWPGYRFYMSFGLHELKTAQDYARNIEENEQRLLKQGALKSFQRNHEANEILGD